MSFSAKVVEFIKLIEQGAIKQAPTLPASLFESLPSADMQSAGGRIIVVTGGNAGLGFDAAKHFAALTPRPARIILGCRTASKGEKAVADIKQATGFKDIETRALDFSSFASVAAFAEGVIKDYGRVDLLIQNAGTTSAHYAVTEDGFESVLQANHLGPSFLILSLLSAVRAAEAARKGSETAVPRIVLVSSAAHGMTELDEELISSPALLKRMSDKEYCAPEPFDRRYADTKLLNIWFARSLQSHLESAGSAIIVNALCPGFVATSIPSSLQNAEDDAYLIKTRDAHAYKPVDASRFLLQAALAKPEQDEKKAKGAWFSSGVFGETSEFSRSETGVKVQKQAWTEALDISKDWCSKNGKLDLISVEA